MSDHRAVPAALLGLHYRAKDDPEHVESWFAKANAPDGQRAIWIRCTVFARPSLPPVAEAWAIAFDRHRGPVAMKSTVPYGTARFGTNEVDVEVDGCTMTTRHGRGSLASGRGSLAWDLAFGPSLAAPIVHFPSPLLYRDGVPPFSKLVSPISDAPRARSPSTARVATSRRGTSTAGR